MQRFGWNGRGRCSRMIDLGGAGRKERPPPLRRDPGDSLRSRETLDRLGAEFDTLLRTRRRRAAVDPRPGAGLMRALALAVMSGSGIDDVAWDQKAARQKNHDRLLGRGGCRCRFLTPKVLAGCQGRRAALERTLSVNGTLMEHGPERSKARPKDKLGNRRRRARNRSAASIAERHSEETPTPAATIQGTALAAERAGGSRACFMGHALMEAGGSGLIVDCLSHRADGRAERGGGGSQRLAMIEGPAR